MCRNSRLLWWLILWFGRFGFRYSSALFSVHSHQEDTQPIRRHCGQAVAVQVTSGSLKQTSEWGRESWLCTGEPGCWCQSGCCFVCFPAAAQKMPTVVLLVWCQVPDRGKMISSPTECWRLKKQWVASGWTSKTLQTSRMLSAQPFQRIVKKSTFLFPLHRE